MLTHEQKIDRIVKQLKERKSITPVSLKKKAVSHEVPKLRDKRCFDEKIDISDLNEIICIDKEKLICVAELGITFLDLAIYDMKKNKNQNYYTILEDELMNIGWLKTLISDNYYSEADFWKIWNKDNYYNVKGQTDPNNIFRNIYTKTCKAVRGLEG